MSTKIKMSEHPRKSSAFSSSKNLSRRELSRDKEKGFETKPYHPPKRLMTNRNGEPEKFSSMETCTLLDVCGACQLINKPYRDQLLEKKLRLKNLLEEYKLKLPRIPVQEFVASPEHISYKQSVRLVVAEHLVRGKPWVDIGFYRHFHGKVVDIGNCPVQSPAINDVIHFLRKSLRTFQIPIYSPKTKEGLLTGVSLQQSRHTKQLMVILHARELKTAKFRELACSILETFPRVEGIFLSPYGQDSLEEKDFLLIAGNATIEEKLHNLDLKLGPSLDFPVYSPMSSLLEARILEMVNLSSLKGPLLEINPGLGILTRCLRSRGHEIHCVNGKSLSSLTFFQTQGIIAHLGKKGLDENFIEQLNSLSPNTFLVSGLAGEGFLDTISSLYLKGFKPIFIEPYDTLPGTTQFDLLCYLSK